MSEARRILELRLASGEINIEEYERVLAKLGATDQVGSAGAPQHGPATATPILPMLPQTPTPPQSVPNEPYPIGAVPAGNVTPPAPRKGTAAAAGIPGHSNLIARVWRGEISLPVTYWVWGIFFSVIASLIVGGIVGASESSGVIGFSLFALALWSIFISVSIFRSGRRYRLLYPNKKIWGRLAQIAACLGLMANLGEIGKLLPGNEPLSELDKEIAELNQKAPQKIDEVTRLEKWTRENRTLQQNMTVMEPAAKVMAGFTEQQWTQVRTEDMKDLCGKSEFRRMLLSIDAMTRTFRNEAGKTLVIERFAKRDCDALK